MKKWGLLGSFASLATSVTFLSIGYAQAQAPAPVGDRMHADDRRPEDRRRDELSRPDQPMPHPGERAPSAAAQAALYDARLRKLDADRRLQRAQQRKDTHAWDTGRAAREQEHRRQLEGVWGPALLSRPECQAELAQHADRVARINRIIDIAEDQHNSALVAHAKAVLSKEIARNARAMAEIAARLGVQ